MRRRPRRRGLRLEGFDWSRCCVLEIRKYGRDLEGVRRPWMLEWSDKMFCQFALAGGIGHREGARSCSL